MEPCLHLDAPPSCEDPAPGPSTQYLRILVIRTIRVWVFGTMDLKYWVLGPFGEGYSEQF